MLPSPHPHASNVVIVDIDRNSLARSGPWPWPRARLAELVTAVAQARPKAVAIDMLLSGADRFPGQPGLDGDTRLKQALADVPAVLGFGLENGARDEDLPAVPILARAPVRLPGIWRADGVVGPEPKLAEAAVGFGAIAQAADNDGLIRRLPLLVLAGETLRPGLSTEVARIEQGAQVLVIDKDGWLHIGAITVPLDRDAMLRLISYPPVRTVPAQELLDDPSQTSALANKIVVIGGSAPELGGLRVTPSSPVTPSVLTQAVAIDAILSGSLAYRPAWLHDAETGCAAMLGLVCVLFAIFLRPAPAAFSAVALCIVWVGIAAASVPGASWLVDPVGPAAVAFCVFGLAALARYARDEWRARLLQARFAQHLAPEVVRRIAANPAMLRMRGEIREITALFSDIEGFTAMTERAEPADLVALLDMYLDAVTRIVVEHGGMVDKIVGDSVHAIFNAPFTLDAHPDHAVACAKDLLTATEQIRLSPLAQKLRLGRTRIGVETGPAIVGDVGGSRKLDYTAHGAAVNRAARLEAANKELGSSICIGPGTASRLRPGSLRSLGIVRLRGVSESIEVFTSD